MESTIKTLVQAVTYFADLNVAHDHIAKMRWEGGTVCPRCGSKDVSYSAKYRRFECKHRHDRRQFTVKTGTIMEDSPMGLDKWAVAIWLEANAKNSISSYEIHRALGITQKSAWFMLHRIRLALKSGSLEEKMGGDGGVVEADETFVGGQKRFMSKRRQANVKHGSPSSGKTIVMGLLERYKDKPSQVRAGVLSGLYDKDIHAVIHKNVEPGTRLYTDAYGPYRRLGTEYLHEFVDHSIEYVKGAVHTNGLENFWTLFKRCIKGTHVSIEPFHLNAYVDSEAFRFNNRELDDGGRFTLALRGIEGKRLTYKALIGVLGASPKNAKGGENEREAAL